MILTLMKKRKRVTTSVVTRVITQTRTFFRHFKSFFKSACTPQVLTPPPQRCVRAGSGLCYVQALMGGKCK
jgi:hypothetical protein